MLRDPDFEQQYLKLSDREDEIENRIYEAKQELLHSLATDHQACMDLVANMDEIDTVLATAIGIIVRVARDKEKCSNPGSIAEMGFMLINALLLPSINMLAESKAANA